MSRSIPRPRRALLATSLFLAGMLASGCQDDASRTHDLALEVARDVLARENVDRYDRVVAAGILLQAGSVEGEEVLLDAMTSGAELAQQAAVGAILSVRGQRAIDWFARYSGEDEKLQRSILEGLRFTPRTDAGELITAGIWHESVGINVAALDAAALARDGRLLGPVESKLSRTEHPRLRAYAIHAACALGTDRMASYVEPLLGSPSELQREIAAACLGFSRDEWARGALEKLARDHSPRVRIAANASLTNHGVPDAKEYLMAQLEGNDPQMAQVAAGSLRRANGYDVIELAGRVLESTRVNVMATGRVIEAVGWAREVEAAPVLKRVLRPDVDDHLRMQGLWAIGWRGRSEELPLAKPLLEDRTLSIRVMAAWALIYGRDGGHQLGTGYVRAS